MSRQATKRVASAVLWIGIAAASPVPNLAHALEKVGVRGESPVFSATEGAPAETESAKDGDKPGTPTVPCATIEAFDGDLQILDPSRTQLIDPRKGAPVHCGGWVSIGRGWAVLRHRSGGSLRVGAGSFVQLLDANTADVRGDVVLYHGQVYASGGHGRGGMEVITPNARAGISRGAALVIYEPESEESQCVALEGTALFENRFELSRQVKLKEGEGSSLSFKLMRVLPSAPRAVSLAGVRSRLAELKLDGQERERAIRAVRARAGRRFASRLGSPNPSTPEIAERKRTSYERHPASEKGTDAVVESRLVNHLVGGSRAGAGAVYPGSPRKGKVKVTDTSSRSPGGRQPAGDEGAEKRRLLEELSKIHED